MEEYLNFTRKSRPVLNSPGLYKKFGLIYNENEAFDSIEFFLKVFTEFSKFSDKNNIIFKRGLCSNLLSLV